MTHEDAFLQDILAQPDDDTPRRIFADWLLDHHDPVLAARGELIHVQCDLAGLAPDSPRRPALASREKQLLEVHGREWGSAFHRLGCQCWEYRRGFVEGVGMPASAFLAHAATLSRTSPVRELKLYDCDAVTADLAACPFLARLHTLDLEKNDLGNADLERLAASPYLGALTTLLTWSNRIGDLGLAALARAGLPRLTRLDLSYNTVGDEGVTALAASPLLGRLRLLDLTANQISDAGARTLANSAHANSLGRLDLTKNRIDAVSQAALRSRFGGRIQM